MPIILTLNIGTSSNGSFFYSYHDVGNVTIYGIKTLEDLTDQISKKIERDLSK